MGVGDKARDRLRVIAGSRPVVPSVRVRRVDPPPSVTGPEVVDYRTALMAISDHDFCLSQKYGEQQWRAERRGAHPDIIEFERVFIKRLRKIDVPMFAHCLWRTGEAQDAAYAAGNSKARAGESAHNFGMAIDLIHGTRGWNLSRMSWAIIGHFGKEIAAQKGFKLTWGGDWKSPWDPAHWEITDWRSLR